MDKLIWYKDGTQNWGDYISPVLYKYITGKESQFVKYDDLSNEERYFIVGSLMEHVVNPNTIIWGLGFMWEHGVIPIVPKKVHAVRGPLTRTKLLNQGVDCPEVYGDPALLISKFYNPIVEEKYELGIIPHYVDSQNEWIKKNSNYSEVKILNICSETHEFINELKKCKKIISSSLHGLIAADSYDIPNKWVEFSNKVGGEGFKFRDYFASVKKEEKIPYFISENTKIEDVFNSISSKKINIDLELLLNLCPFKK